MLPKFVAALRNPEFPDERYILKQSFHRAGLFDQALMAGFRWGRLGVDMGYPLC
jgi:hypothetical protein